MQVRVALIFVFAGRTPRFTRLVGAQALNVAKGTSLDTGSTANKHREIRIRTLIILFQFRKVYIKSSLDYDLNRI
jgi:hypothetical protein